MSAVIVLPNRIHEPEAWAKARRRGIGGSEIAAVCGLSRWRSPLEVWLRKLDLEEPPRNETEFDAAGDTPWRSPSAPRSRSGWACPSSPITGCTALPICPSPSARPTPA